MAYYKLYRKEPQGKAVHGTLYLCQPGRRNETLLVKAAETLENTDYLIPALIYKVVVTMSPRFGKLLPLLRNVPNRTGIRIHGGVKPEHSKGCILCTRKNEYKNVVERLLYEQKQNEDIYIEIIQPGHEADEQKNIVSINYSDYEKVPTQTIRSIAA